MRPATSTIALLVTCALFSRTLSAQTNNQRSPASSPQAAMEAARAEAQRAMAPLMWMVGEWEGPASISVGEGRTLTLTQHETVHGAAFNTAMLIRGSGSMMQGASTREVFQAAGLLAFDQSTGKFVFASSGGSGSAASHETSVEGSTLTWSYADGTGARTRYVISHTPDDKWRETGAVSRDGGTTWLQNFEMTLVRKR